MKLTKGISGNPKGKYNKPIKSKLEALLCKTFPIIESEIENANPDTMREFFIDIAGIVFYNNKQAI